MAFKIRQHVRIKAFPGQKCGKPAVVLRSHLVGTLNLHGAFKTYEWEYLVRDNQGRESRHYEDGLEAIEESADAIAQGVLDGFNNRHED